MTDLMIIELKHLHFFAYHGLYAEEKKIGNEFEINLSVGYSPVSGVITDISETINYTKLYELLKSEMEKPRNLLETLVMEIAELIHASFPIIKKVEIEITKLHSPIVKFTGITGVKYIREY